MVLNSMTMTNDDLTTLIHRLLLRRGKRVAASSVADALGAPAVHQDGVERLRLAARALGALGMPGRVVRVPFEQARALGPTLAVFAAEPVGDAALVLVPGPRGECRLAQGQAISPPSSRADVAAIDLRAEVRAPHIGTWLWRSVCAESPYVLTAIVALLLSQGLALMGPAAAWLVTDRALPDGAWQLLTLAVLGLVAIALHGAALGWWRDRVTRSLDQRLRTRANAMMFEALLHTPYASARQRTAGDAFQLLSSAEQIAGSALSVGLSPVLGMASAALAWVALCAVLPAAAWALAAGCLALLLLSVPLARQNIRWQGDTLRARAGQQSLLLELLQGVAALRVAGAEHAGARRWLRCLIDEQTATLGQVRSGLWLDVLLEGGMLFTRAAWLAWGGAACVSGELSLGAFLAGAMLSEQVMQQTIGLSHASMSLSAMAPHWRRVNAALKEAAGSGTLGQSRAVALRSLVDKPPVKSTEPALRLDGLWFRYDEQAAWAVRDHSLEVPDGSLVVLSGASGAGKTTLLRLAAGLLEPQQGRVEVFGQPVRAGLASVGYLPQEAPLFEGSIASNLRLLAGCSPAHLMDVASRTGLDEWVSTLPMRYATRVSAGGGSFSGGQRQLIALTAVLASDRRLLLLDEPMSQLDRLSRRRLLDSGLFQGRSIVIISHDRNGLDVDDTQTSAVVDLAAPAVALVA